MNYNRSASEAVTIKFQDDGDGCCHLFRRWAGPNDGIVRIDHDIMIAPMHRKDEYLVARYIYSDGVATGSISPERHYRDNLKHLLTLTGNAVKAVFEPLQESYLGHIAGYQPAGHLYKIFCGVSYRRVDNPGQMNNASGITIGFDIPKIEDVTNHDDVDLRYETALEVSMKENGRNLGEPMRIIVPVSRDGSTCLYVQTDNSVMGAKILNKGDLETAFTTWFIQKTTKMGFPRKISQDISPSCEPCKQPGR